MPENHYISIQTNFSNKRLQIKRKVRKKLIALEFLYMVTVV